MQRNVSDAAIITIPVSADSKKASASSVRNGAIFLGSVQLGKNLINQLSLWTEKMAIHLILRTVFVPSSAPTDSSKKKFTVKITVGRENVDFLVDFLVDTGSVRTIIGEFVCAYEPIIGLSAHKNRHFITLIYW